jgi:predicted acetyltransferase
VDIEVRTLREPELRSSFATVETAFGERLGEEFFEFHRPFVELDRTLGAFDGAVLVGSASAISYAMTVPGGELPVAGVTGVGVLPTHRRRGANTALMRAQLDDSRRRGEAAAALYASQGGIYGRYGYGIAALNASIDLETQRSAFGPWYEPSGGVRLVDRDEAVQRFLPVYDEIRRARPGMMRLDERTFGYVLDDRFRHTGKPRPGFFAAHETDGRIDGYVQYRIKHRWDVVPRNELHVDDLLATTPAAYADLWRYVLDVDLVGRVRAWNRPSDEPLLHLVLEPRPLKLSLKDGLWLRLVDVEEALRARTYRGDLSTVFEVKDAFCPWNDGRYELRWTGADAICRRTDADPDLVLGVGELGAAYLGGTRLLDLHRAGRVVERSTGALARADEAFAWNPAPWCSFSF